MLYDIHFSLSLDHLIFNKSPLIDIIRCVSGADGLCDYAWPLLNENCLLTTSPLAFHPSFTMLSVYQLLTTCPNVHCLLLDVHH